MRRLHALTGIALASAGIVVIVGVRAANRSTGVRAESVSAVTDAKDADGSVAPHDAPVISAGLVVEASGPPAILGGVDLTAMAFDDSGVTAHAPQGRIARLTLDPVLQRTASNVMAAYRIPQAAVVLMDPDTGHVLAYASHFEKEPKFDLAARAIAPAASVFKVVTGAALVEHAGLGPDTKQCFSGGEQRILAVDLVDNPQRDRWCTNLAGAMGRSINTVFARLAQKNLDATKLQGEASKFGFGEALAFDVPVETSSIKIPQDPLGFARTAAGFWNTTLSPIHGATIASMIARGGEAVRPTIVRELVGPDKTTLYTAPSSPAIRRAVTPEVAASLTRMMEHTVSEGTSYKSFHDPAGKSFLPGMQVAGKTGTLTDPQDHRFFTWFVGFAPAEPVPGVKRVAVATLVVNEPTWHVKANLLAREMLRAAFAEQKVPNVTAPSVSALAQRDHGARPVRKRHGVRATP